MIIEDILEHNARRNHDRAAVIYEGRALTYSVLRQAIGLLSVTLQELAQFSYCRNEEGRRWRSAAHGSTGVTWPDGITRATYMSSIARRT